MLFEFPPVLNLFSGFWRLIYGLCGSLWFDGWCVRSGESLLVMILCYLLHPWHVGWIGCMLLLLLDALLRIGLTLNIPLTQLLLLLLLD
jgi:hypothetical protein